MQCPFSSSIAFSFMALNTFTGLRNKKEIMTHDTYEYDTTYSGLNLRILEKYYPVKKSRKTIWFKKMVPLSFLAL